MNAQSKYSRTEYAQFSEFNLCQKIFVGLLGLILLYLVGFIIYMCFTWDKVRINEYS